MNSEHIDLLLDVLKFLGLFVTAATGIVGVLATKTWEEYTIRPAIFVPGQEEKTKRRFTKWGWWSLLLMVMGAVVGFGALAVETVRTRHKETLEAKQKKDDQTAHAQEITRIQHENQEEIGKRLEAQSLRMAEMFFQGRELDSQRAAFLEQARLAGLQVKIP
ncbi:MAG TPA: hypothetical protein VNT99_00565, partial [Methylomirabilota bacterium]|nr:hypothetical protein [Methylomirabilota bacterium]